MEEKRPATVASQVHLETRKRQRSLFSFFAMIANSALAYFRRRK
jgi:hypothetical protein